ncbi:PstS family phosphate ABC transporter substrate-binding protein [Oscillatoria sp. FACHB-1407]|uniref:PstS family phosphate ABC transporter substrate-binding protein n=1 Tax=Oscillatoria sp. FACHB-1407 TaxID=2692847 RepID=UPI001686EE82|nr:PstS family phosphate ABC transporter substrate-binding protein [Oscillatoria sp. FACHB-1407]MBD2463815.1 PstS family phosphate ABC transporter substrate-binding protein [Oscillatoria sp. FACHB-1407]
MRLASTLSLVVLLGSLAACASGGDQTATTESPAATDTAASPASDLSGDILVDGSSTVFPIGEAMAEEFMAANPNVRVTVGTSGTGGGFEKFCNGETVVSNASRQIKDEEIALCQEKGVEFIELPVAYDALTVVVNPQNDWATCLTTDELKTVWEPGAQGTVTNWNQVRADFPDAPLDLFGPGTDSGTFDYFTDEINGEEGASRGDFTASEDDNVLVQGVEGDVNALGYFGYAYYAENQDRLKAVEIDSGSGCVAPSPETVVDGTYTPLSRPLFIYVSKQAADERPEVKAFIDFMLDPANKGFVEETGYVPMADDIYTQVKERFEKGETGKTES